MAEENTPRVYGMADQANRHPPAAQGMRGEQAAAGPRPRDPEFAHMVTLENGKRVPVSESNGVAYAEASGRIARPEDRELEIDFTPEDDVQVNTASPASRRPSKAPLMIGALTVGAAAGVYLIERLRRSATAQPKVTPTFRPARPPAPERQETAAVVPAQHETGPLVPVQQLPHQQPILDEISPSASRT